MIPVSPRAHDAAERLGHGVARFSDGDNQYTLERSQIVGILADAQLFTVERHMMRESVRDAALQQRAVEHLSRAVAHFAKHGFRRQRRVGHAGRLYAASLEPLLVQPALDRQAHFGKVAFEEVVSGNEHQLLRIGSLLDDPFQRLVRAELVVVAADEELGLGTLAEKRKRIDTALGRDWSSQRYQGAHVGIGTAGAQPGRGAEGESSEDDLAARTHASATPARLARRRLRHVRYRAGRRSVPSRGS